MQIGLIQLSLSTICPPTFSTALLLIKGPQVLVGNIPSPTLSALTLLANAVANLS